LTIYLPPRTKASGTGIIVVPGGAFVALAIDLEGHRVAPWLQERGVAAFVVKYRIMEKREEGIPPQANMDESGKYRIADGIEVPNVVSAARCGVGSASWVSAEWSAAEPCFRRRPQHVRISLRLSYDGPFGVMPAIPAKLPPTLLARAQVDTLVRNAIFNFYDALISAGHKPQVYLFSAGGHGFGIRKAGHKQRPPDRCILLLAGGGGFTRPAGR
jgi:hypothetical protein